MGSAINANANAIQEELARFHRPDGRWCMYVKPFTVDLKKELEGHRTCKHAAKSISVTEKDGTYCITSKDILHDFRDLRGSLWFMIYWRFRCEARNTFATEVTAGNNHQKKRWCDNEMNMPYTEENKENYFYVVTLSPQFIEATSLPRFQGAA